MAKRRTRQRVEIKQGIEIKRNVIEKFLMNLKAYVKGNRKGVLYLSIGFIISVVLIIAGFVYIEHVATRDQARFGKIMSNYNKYSTAGNKEKINETINELKEFIDSTYFGFAHEMGYYALGNIYYSEKKYKEAEKYLAIFVDKSSSSLFKSLALLKAAIALEEIGDLQGALNIYKELEEDFSESLIADQIYFNYARICSKNNDLFNSKKYYNKVISTFPQSLFAGKAKKRLFLLKYMGAIRP